MIQTIPQKPLSGFLFLTPYVRTILSTIKKQVDKQRHRTRFKQFYYPLFGAFKGSHYRSSKYQIIFNQWNSIKQLIQGLPVSLAPSFVEIHPAEPCQLSCLFCRGGLRKVPHFQTLMKRETLLSLIDEIYALNPKTFVRISGIIGEPLLHPSIVDALKKVNDYQFAWGLTTNGLNLNKAGILSEAIRAKYVHISIDAGSDFTYQALKNGSPGDFERVLANIKALVEAKKVSSSGMEIVCSVLLQSENYLEISELSQRLKAIGVNVFTVKVQHFDDRRGMSAQHIQEAYRILESIKKRDQGLGYSVTLSFSEEEALLKIQKDSKAIDFPECFANKLGLNATIDPQGNLQSCCQYYDRTLGQQGQIEKCGFSKAWNGEQRQKQLQKDPRQHCSNCSPSDQFLNSFVGFLKKAQEDDPHFVSWVEKKILKNNSLKH